MNPIRPGAAPILPGAAPAKPNEAARAAQRAFFEMAMGRSAPAAETAPAAAATRPSPVVQPSAALPAEAPQRPMRPGSLLDIRV